MKTRHAQAGQNATGNRKFPLNRYVDSAASRPQKLKGMFAVMMMGCCILATGCANDQEDIRKWMGEQTTGMRGAVKPLPEIRIFPVVDYIVVNEMEPFNTARIEPAKPEKRRVNDPRLDPDRQREPLEAYPLESLKMVGVLGRGKSINALIQADKVLYQARVGNFIGRNYGKVISIKQDSLEIQELVEDLNEGWIERVTTMQLQERQEAKQ